MSRKADKEEAALEDLLQRIRRGEEFPDACGFSATNYGVNYDLLREMYDIHCGEQ